MVLDFTQATKPQLLQIAMNENSRLILSIGQVQNYKRGE
jgi:hypothetical protein